MNSKMTKYFKVSAVAFINTLEYRLDFFFDLISKFFPAVIQWFMWTSIFSNSSDKVIMNYTYDQMILYTIISVFVASFISVNIHWGIAEEIKNGILSKYIILPLKYFWYKVFQFVGSKLVSLSIVGIGICIVLYWFQSTGYVTVTVRRTGAFLAIVLLALALQYLIYYCVAGIAFWLGECGGVFTVINVISLIISGAVFPLDIFGRYVVKISQFFPFYYITYFPTNVVIGKVSQGQIQNAICVMIIWFILLSCLSVLIWKKGLRKYIAAGG